MSFHKGLLFATFCVLCCSFPVVGQTGRLENRFRTEAPDKWKEYLEETKKYHQWKISKVTKDRLNGDKVNSRSSVVMKSRGSSKLLQNFFYQPEERQHSWVINDRYAFELRRKSDSEPWEVMALHTDLTNWSKNPMNRFFEWNNSKNDPALSLDRFFLPDYLDKPDFKINKISGDAGPEGSLVKIDFVYTASEEEKKGRNAFLENGQMILDPDHHWCIRSFEITEMAPSRNRGTISDTREFRENDKGFLVMTKSMRRVRCPGENADVDQVTEYVTDEKEPGPEEFTLPAFGLPSPYADETQPSRWYLWFAAGAVILLAAGGYFWYRSDRSRKLFTQNSPTGQAKK